MSKAYLQYIAIISNHINAEAQRKAYLQCECNDSSWHI